MTNAFRNSKYNYPYINFLLIRQLAKAQPSKGGQEGEKKGMTKRILLENFRVLKARKMKNSNFDR